MKAILIAAVVAVAMAMTDVEQWASFKATYGKSYTGMGGQDAYRFSVFQTNLRRAEEYQRNDPHATYGVTMFSDLTQQEFRKYYANLNTTQVAAWHRTLPVGDLSGVQAAGADWRSTRVTSVKDQGQCGSCWAFSTAAAAEACTATQGKLQSLSAQQVVDCCTAGGSDGCNGGWPDQCLSWAMGQNLATEASYPYKTAKQTCKTSFTTGLAKGSCGYKGVTGGETGTVAALAKNPVSICLDATPLQSYVSGIISGTTCNQHSVDHAVLLVAELADSYVVKNSWAAGWGEAGFFRIAKGVNCLAFTSYNSYVQ